MMIGAAMFDIDRGKSKNFKNTVNVHFSDMKMLLPSLMLPLDLNVNFNFLTDNVLFPSTISI